LIEPFYQVVVVSFLCVYTLDRVVARLQARDFLHSMEELNFPSDDPIMTSKLKPDSYDYGVESEAESLLENLRVEQISSD